LDIDDNVSIYKVPSSVPLPWFCLSSERTGVFWAIGDIGARTDQPFAWPMRYQLGAATGHVPGRTSHEE